MQLSSTIKVNHDYSHLYILADRQKEDPWNAIISGFLTGGSLAARGGPQMIISSGIACGVLLGVIEGVGVLMQRMFAEGRLAITWSLRKKVAMSDAYFLDAQATSHKHHWYELLHVCAALSSEQYSPFYLAFSDRTAASSSRTDALGFFLHLRLRLRAHYSDVSACRMPVCSLAWKNTTDHTIIRISFRLYAKLPRSDAS